VKKGILIICILAPFLLGTACNKDKEKVAELEKEVRQDEANNIILDTIRTHDSVTKTIDSALAVEPPAKSEIEFTPDRTPDENYGNLPEKKPAVKTMADIPAIVADQSQTPMTSKISGGYTIQIGSGIDKADAEKLMQEYIGKGYRSFISEKVTGGVIYYRVRIGHFNNIAEAHQLGQELKEKYAIDYWIDKGQ
jgi:cell division septation protein DedD